MSGTKIPAKTGNTRVFMIEGRARPDHTPSYKSTLRMTGLSQGFGDVSPIQEPDPYKYDSYVNVGQTRAEIERATTSLEGRYALNLISDLLRLAKAGCPVDVQLHMGQCTDPSQFNTFEKALILEDAYLTNWSTEDLGALQSGDRNPVNETSDVSADVIYEVVPMTFGEKAGSVVTNEVLDAVRCDSPSCGDCESESDGCQKIYAISSAAGGSPSTPPDIVYSLDGGLVWVAHDIDSMLTAETPSGVDCLGQYVVVVSNATASLHYALLSEMDGVTDPTWTEVATGFVTGGEPNAIDSFGGKAFIVGDNGYVYVTEDATAGVEVLDAGVATVSVLNDVHALSENFLVAVGNDGAVIYSENGETFAVATAPVGVGVHLNCVDVKNESEWWVGTSGGRVYVTLDGGSTWTEQAFPGSGSGVVYDIKHATESVMFLAHATSTPRGRILRSYDGGNSWVVLPERTGASMPLNDRINVLVVCPEDPNFVVGAGLADNATDGFIVLGAG